MLQKETDRITNDGDFERDKEESLFEKFKNK